MAIIPLILLIAGGIVVIGLMVAVNLKNKRKNKANREA